MLPDASKGYSLSSIYLVVRLLVISMHILLIFGFLGPLSMIGQVRFAAESTEAE